MAFTDKCKFCGFILCDCMAQVRLETSYSKPNAALEMYKNILAQRNKPSRFERFLSAAVHTAVVFVGKRK